MSVELVSRVLHHSRAKGHSKVVLIGLAWHTDDQSKGCWPTRELLAIYANISPRQVTRCILELQDLGEIQVVKNGAWMRGSASMNNLYQIRIVCPDWCDGTLNHRHLDMEPLDNVVHPPRHICPPPLDNIVHTP